MVWYSEEGQYQQLDIVPLLTLDMFQVCGEQESRETQERCLRSHLRQCRCLNSPIDCLVGMHQIGDASEKKTVVVANLAEV
jgi:hypothetical protein